jgi:uncharacterized protein YbaR (Trm112 family)
LAAGEDIDELEIPACPVCSGQLEVVYNRYHQRVAVCVDCHSGLTIPGSAWHVAKLKREGKWTSKKTE